MWVVHWGLLLRLAGRAWVCPCEGQAWRWCTCLGHRGSGSTRYSGELVARAAGNSVPEGYGNQCWPICSRILAWRTPLPDREAWQATVHRVTKCWTRLKRPCTHRCKTFFACGSSVPVRIGREGGAAVWLAGTLAVPSVQGHRRPLPQELWPYRSLFSRGYGDGFTLCVTQQYRLSSMAAWPSSTGISHHNLLLHIPSICLSTVNSSPCPGIAPHSLNSSSQLLCLPGDLCPCPGYVWLRQGLSDSHSI